MNLFNGRLPHVTVTGRQVCTKEAPYRNCGHDHWHHPDARETDADSDYYIEYRCPNCGLVFRTEMPD